MRTFLCFMIYFILTICLGTIGKAQTAISSSGGDVSGTGGSLSYTIGQTAFESYSSIYGSCTQGIQQQYPNSVGNILSQIKNITCEVYPNPTNRYITVKHSTVSNFNIEIYNTQGLCLLIGKTTEQETELDLARLPSNLYILKIYNNTEFSTFYIIKN